MDWIRIHIGSGSILDPDPYWIQIQIRSGLYHYPDWIRVQQQPGSGSGFSYPGPKHWLLLCVFFLVIELLFFCYRMETAPPTPHFTCDMFFSKCRYFLLWYWALCVLKLSSCLILYLWSVLGIQILVRIQLDLDPDPFADSKSKYRKAEIIPKKRKIKSFLSFKNFVDFSVNANLVANGSRFLFNQNSQSGSVGTELIWIRTTASCLCDHVEKFALLTYFWPHPLVCFQIHKHSKMYRYMIFTWGSSRKVPGWRGASGKSRYVTSMRWSPAKSVR